MLTTLRPKLMRLREKWEEHRARRQPAQVLVLFALAAIPLMGFVGLAVDGGNILAQRRIVQNGADAGVLAGLRDMARGSSSTALNSAQSYAQTNAGAGFKATNATLTIGPASGPVFINNAGTEGVDQSLATGVKVTVTKTFSTYFLNVIQIPTFTVSASASGKLQKWGQNVGPFLVCVDGLKDGSNLTDNQNNPNDWFANGILDFTTPSNPTVRPEALNQDFFVHGSKLGQNDGACGWNGASNYKGVADTSYTGCTTVPCSYPYDGGTSSGPITFQVVGVAACAGTSDQFVDGCVAILPVVAQKNSARDTCSPSTPSGSMCVLAWVPFQLRVGSGSVPGCGTNCHVGRPLGTVLLKDTPGVDCTPPCSGALMIKLTQ
jgi:Flp pilus assembly protein TadG